MEEIGGNKIQKRGRELVPAGRSLFVIHVGLVFRRQIEQDGTLSFDLLVMELELLLLD